GHRPPRGNSLSLPRTGTTGTPPGPDRILWEGWPGIPFGGATNGSPSFRLLASTCRRLSSPSCLGFLRCRPREPREGGLSRQHAGRAPRRRRLDTSEGHPYNESDPYNKPGSVNLF